MKTIMILMDTLNRHMLKTYNPQAKAKTPNIDRLAERSVVFNQHFIGSAPCMPARRDIQTGRLNFLERGWGPIEPYDRTLPALLREKGIFSHIVTDHCHYAEIGGEGYMQQYDTWDMIRGQETDVWGSQIEEPEYPENPMGIVFRQYQCNRRYFTSDAKRPTPKTFAQAIKWLKANERADNYFLTVETFDPHEPFDASEEFKEMYPDNFQRFYEWPRYAELNEEETPEAVEHLRNQYYAVLSMADKWLGKLLDEFDRQNLWEDTCVIFTSDHGHMLGEHNVTGKNRYHAWNEMARIPLFIHIPGSQYAGERRNGVTQNIDLFPTIIEFFGVNLKDMPLAPHGKSLWPVLYKKAEKVRDYAIYGWFGKPVNITDGTYTYFRAAGAENSPLYAYMGLPASYHKYWGAGLTEETFCAGKYLKHISMPVYRLNVSKAEPEEPYLDITESHLYNIETDPGQMCPIQDLQEEERLCRALVREMKNHDAPSEQYIRLKLQKYL